MTDSPHYLLLSESSSFVEPGRWRFVLRSADGRDNLVADDVEPEVRGERLELLAVVRGLEALDQPSRVTLITSSVYVSKGIRHGLGHWRQNGWQWEYYGEMVPVKNGDLWQRVDRAMRFHEVECRSLRFDPPHQGPSDPDGIGRPHRRTEQDVPAMPQRLWQQVRRFLAFQRWQLARNWQRWRQRLAAA